MIRFKKFCNILLGKNQMDQIMDTFDGESANKFYNSIATQNDKFYILNISKLVYDIYDGWDIHNNTTCEHKIINPGNSFYYSLYMSKQTGSIIFKAPVIYFSRNQNNENNNIATFLSHNLKKLNIIKFEFLYKWKSFYKGNLNEIKILIPDNMNEDNFVRLINLIEGLNNFLLKSDVRIWDNLNEVRKNVKIDF